MGKGGEKCISSFMSLSAQAGLLLLVINIFDYSYTIKQKIIINYECTSGSTWKKGSKGLLVPSNTDRLLEEAIPLTVTVVAPYSNMKARKISSLWGTEGTVSTQHLLISKQQLRQYLSLTVAGGPALLHYNHIRRCRLPFLPKVKDSSRVLQC